MNKFLTSRIVAALCLALFSFQSFAGTITGNVQNAQSGPVANGTFSFTLNAPATLAGTATIATMSVNCYTDANGAIVNEPNPLIGPILSTNLGSGTLAAGTYFVKFTYRDATGTSFPSPELPINLAAPGTLIVNPPVKQPASTTSVGVYIGTASGNETLQGTVTVSPGSWGSYSQSVALAAGAALPVSNTTVCTVIFNDQLTPSFTCYDVGLTNSITGANIPGFPQWWYVAGGSAGTVNISSGTPQSNVCQGSGIVYPQAVLTLPPFNATQTINGGLNLNGFPLTAGPGSFTTLSASGLATLSGGVCYTFENGKAKVIVSASCGYTTWALALAACPSTGCIMDGTAPDVPLALGAFDTGSNTKPVTVRLGRTLASGCFTAQQIVVRQGLDFGGVDILDTCLTSVGTNAQPLFVIPQVNNNAITTKIHDLSINGLSGNTSQDGIFFDASTLTNAGTELTQYYNLIFSGFNGSSIHLKATQDGASGSVGAIQGITFTNITATRPTGATGATQNALRIEGGVGQIDFYNCWLNGNASDTGQNVFVGTSGTQAPYSIHFHSTTCQNGNCYLFDGGTSLTTIDDHFEVLKGAYLLKTTSQLLVGVNIKTPHINSNVGVNAGNGYIVSIPNTVTNAEVMLDTPLVYSTPDKLVNNAAGNSASVKVINARTFNSATPVNVYATVGITGTLTPAATVDLKSWNTIQVSASATSMSTFKSTLMPGETVTLYATGGTIQFATGGNLTFGSQSSPLIVQSGDSATFMRVDAGTPAFILVSNPSKPTLTPKKGSGAGNYTSASTTYVVMDATNLCYTVTIPTGWKLSVTATAEMNTATAAVTFFLAVTDNAACSTANAGVIAETTAASTGTGTALSVSLNPVITGDGASHSVALQFKTSAGADSVAAVNASATRTPMMTFNLSPSN